MAKETDGTQVNTEDAGATGDETKDALLNGKTSEEAGGEEKAGEEKAGEEKAGEEKKGEEIKKYELDKSDYEVAIDFPVENRQVTFFIHKKD